MTKDCLKVLLVSPLPPPAGGIASWTTQYIDWAKKNGLSVEVVNTALIGSRSKKINSKTRILDEIKRTEYIIRELRKKITEFKPLVVHLNTPCGELGIIRDSLIAFLVKKQDIKLIVHYRCNLRDQVRNSTVHKFFLKRISEKADINIVLNTDSKFFLESETNNNSILLSNFINRDFVLNTPPTIREKIELISFVGHIQPTKGIFEIVEVAKKMPNILFKLAGPTSDEVDSINLPTNLVLLGILSKQSIRELLINSDVFLFPSHSEGFANALLEAMSLGLPIITTPVGANADMIESFGGAIVEVGDSQGIIDAIYLMNQASIRQKMSTWNIEKVKKDYLTERVMEKVVNLYSDVIHKYNKE